jgi:carbon-monoxide dehydrogenase small subunit
MGAELMKLKFTLNGEPVEILVSADKTLLRIIRDDIRVMGTKEGCEEGECGACTVILDGKAVNACLVPAIQLEGREVLTIEGLSDGKRLHKIQQAFVDAGAIQCGYCTPGMVMSVFALLSENPKPSEDEVRNAISGNLCRCTGYQKIIDAVKHACAE